MLHPMLLTDPHVHKVYVTCSADEIDLRKLWQLHKMNKSLASKHHSPQHITLVSDNAITAG